MNEYMVFIFWLLKRVMINFIKVTAIIASVTGVIFGIVYILIHANPEVIIIVGLIALFIVIIICMTINDIGNDDFINDAFWDSLDDEEYIKRLEEEDKKEEMEYWNQ